MRKYAVKINKSIRGDKVFYDLLINEQNLFQEFCNEIQSRNQKKLNSEVVRIISRFNLFANNRRFDKTQIKRLCKIKKYTLWEIKTKNLRVYFIHHAEQNYIIFFGGTKKSQKKDIPKFKKMAEKISTIELDFE